MSFYLLRESPLMKHASANPTSLHEGFERKARDTRHHMDPLPWPGDTQEPRPRCGDLYLFWKPMENLSPGEIVFHKYYKSVIVKLLTYLACNMCSTHLPNGFPPCSDHWLKGKHIPDKHVWWLWVLTLSLTSLYFGELIVSLFIYSFISPCTPLCMLS